MRRILALSLGVLICGCGSGGGGGASCVLSSDCGADQYCQFAAGACGDDGNQGSCTELSGQACAEGGTPVCSCEGLTFFNECFAAAAGQSIRAQVDCG